jgi:DNA mismatch repair protein MutS2
MSEMRKEKVNKFAPKIEKEIDLHGFYEREAIETVEEFLISAENKNYKRVRIITGKGTGVLQQAVRKWLMNNEYFFETAKITEGGSGALIVKL